LEALLRYIETLSPTGVLTGRVTDRTTRAGISGATVAYANGTTTTDPSGDYHMTEVPPGTYALSASASGYLSATQEITVTLGASVSANFALVPVMPSGSKQFTVTLPLILTMPSS